MADEEAAEKTEFTPDPGAVERARDISPEATHEERIPETVGEDERAGGLGKGVGLPPGSTGYDAGMTPTN
ncbi:MAG: hypothetical protein NVSMB32_14580 [Actinomycetota bacterium]